MPSHINRTKFHPVKPVPETIESSQPWLKFCSIIILWLNLLLRSNYHYYNPLGVSPSKGKQGSSHEAKKKSFDLGGNRTHDLRIRSTVTLPTELQGRTEKVGDDFRW